MEFLGLLVVFFGSLLIIVIAATLVLSLKRRSKGISKDYAEQIAIRRFVQGRTIGARFTREGRRWVWEFDVLDGKEIRRVSVDARSAAVIRARTLMPEKTYLQSSASMLGNRIG